MLNRVRARVGTTVCHKWRIDALLGMGGMASVYAATHRNGREVAIKVLHPQLAAESELRQRFLREGYAANRVNHPGVVAVLDDDVAEDGSVFLVMERLHGASLDHFIGQPSTLSNDETLLVAARVLDILAAAHAKDIIHRDVKPENVFITKSGEVKLLDFGIARVREQQRAGSPGTQAGLPMGTPAFMPPEQARGHWDAVDPRSDLFSVGAMVYALMTGARPRSAPTVNEELLLAMTEPLPSILARTPEAPQLIVDFVNRAASFEKTARFTNAETMAAAAIDAWSSLTGQPSDAMAYAKVRAMPITSNAVPDYWNESGASESGPAVETPANDHPNDASEPTGRTLTPATVKIPGAFTPQHGESAKTPGDVMAATVQSARIPAGVGGITPARPQPVAGVSARTGGGAGARRSTAPFIALAFGAGLAVLAVMTLRESPDATPKGTRASDAPPHATPTVPNATSVASTESPPPSMAPEMPAETPTAMPTALAIDASAAAPTAHRPQRTGPAPHAAPKSTSAPAPSSDPLDRRF